MIKIFETCRQQVNSYAEFSKRRFRSQFPTPLLARAFNIPSHLTRQELVCLRNIAKTLASKSICVEIGSYLGASAVAIVDGIWNKEGSTLYCVDTWMNHAMVYAVEEREIPALQVQDTYSSFCNNIEPCMEVVTCLRGLSHEMYEHLKPVQQIDLLFIDGDHSYEAVYLDWLLYSKKLAGGSIVVFHDTGWAEGVQRTIREDVNPRCTLIKVLPNMQVFICD